jgi:hypothetical protein
LYHVLYGLSLDAASAPVRLSLASTHIKNRHSRNLRAPNMTRSSGWSSSVVPEGIQTVRYSRTWPACSGHLSDAMHAHGIGGEIIRRLGLPVVGIQGVLERGHRFASSKDWGPPVRSDCFDLASLNPGP